MSDKVIREGGRWSNAAEDAVEIRQSDPSWPTRFADEARAIRSALGDGFVYEIHHVGSTAVPGLAAKPIVDIILEVPNRDSWAALIAPLKRLGYVYWAENPDTSRMFFVKGMPPFGTGRTHHVHVRTPDGAKPVVRFRDHLIAHPEDAKRYEELKRQLSAEFATDRDAYTKAKERFVHEVLRQAQQARPQTERPEEDTDMTTAKGVVVPAGGGTHLDMRAPGRFAALKLLGHETNESIMLFEETTPAGTKSLFHLHRDSDEVAWVLEGEITFKIGDEITVGGPGTCAFMPRNVAHAWKNSGAGTGRVLFLYTPAGAGGYLEGLRERPAGPMSAADQDKLCERYHWEILGPNPL